MDVRRRSSVTDYYVMATGNSAPHIKALQSNVECALKAKGEQCYRKAGIPEGGWMVLDYVDVIVHIFTKETREYYALETLWGKGGEDSHYQRGELGSHCSFSLAAVAGGDRIDAAALRGPAVSGPILLAEAHGA
jgi:ribosome silencing factor RsfS/YbeB/iojap